MGLQFVAMAGHGLILSQDGAAASRKLFKVGFWGSRGVLVVLWGPGGLAGFWEYRGISWSWESRPGGLVGSCGYTSDHSST